MSVRCLALTVRYRDDVAYMYCAASFSPTASKCTHCPHYGVLEYPCLAWPLRTD
jgi:hypothetical protein